MEVNMSRKGSFWFSLTAFFVLAVILVIGGALLYQAGQAQGYALGLAATSGDAPAALPAAGVYAVQPWVGFPGAGLWFALLCLLPLAFIVFLSALRFVTWRIWGGPSYYGYRRWGRHHWHPGWPPQEKSAPRADEPI
jgi:hypothetical protein